MTTIFEVLHRKAEPYKVTLSRGQKGTYGWDIQVSANTANMAIEMLRFVDKQLRTEYQGGEEKT